VTYLPPRTTITAAGILAGGDGLSISQSGAARTTTLGALKTFILSVATQPTVPVSTLGPYDDYFKASAARETRGVFDPTVAPNYQQESSSAYPALGAYQFDKQALIAVGYYRDDGNLSGLPWQDAFFTGLDGITSKTAFLNNPTIQTKAARTWNQVVGWPGITYLGLQTYVGRTIAGIKITAAGLLGGTSLLGPNALQSFLVSNGATDPTDGFGTHISEYVRGLAPYMTPFDPP
jgi:hypothetical protein